MRSAQTKKAPPWVGFLIGMLTGLFLSLSTGHTFKSILGYGSGSQSTGAQYRLVQFGTSQISQILSADPGVVLLGNWPELLVAKPDINYLSQDTEVAPVLVTSTGVFVRVSAWSALYSDSQSVRALHTQALNRGKMKSVLPDLEGFLPHRQ